MAWHLSHFATRRPQELALSTLMRFVQLEGVHPLEKPKWDGCYLFPHQLFKVGAKWGWGAGKGPGALADEHPVFAAPSPAEGVWLAP